MKIVTSNLPGNLHFLSFESALPAPLRFYSHNLENNGPNAFFHFRHSRFEKQKNAGLASPAHKKTAPKGCLDGIFMLDYEAWLLCTTGISLTVELCVSPPDGLAGTLGTIGSGVGTVEVPGLGSGVGTIDVPGSGFGTVEVPGSGAGVTGSTGTTGSGTTGSTGTTGSGAGAGSG